jgi:flagellar biosynthesis/type III secretory pathway protein FliH
VTTSTEFSFEALAEPEPVAPATPAEAVSPADAVLAAMARAEEEAETMRELARAEGREQGHLEALESARPAVEALAAAVEALRAERAELAERLERHAVDLALMLAEKVVGAAIAVAPELVVESVRGALRTLVERERVTVLVHPDDLDVVRAAMDELRATLGGIEHCEVQAERRVSRGGCIVRTPEGDVDGRIETKLERARDVVQGALS